MMSKPIWIDRGRPVSHIAPAEMPDDPDVTFRLFGLLRYSRMYKNERRFSLLEWDNHNCHPSCLEFASNSIHAGHFKPPFIFRVYCLGWLSERHETVASAVRRIAELGTLGATTAFPGSHFVSADRDFKLAQVQLEAVSAGKCNSRLVVSKLTADGTNPILRVGEHSVLSHINGKEQIGLQKYRLNDTFRHGDKHMVKTFEDALGTGRPQLQEVAMLVPNRSKEAWWLRMHRLCVPQRGNRIISYCIQGQIAPGLRSALFGRPGFEIPTWTLV